MNLKKENHMESCTRETACTALSPLTDIRPTVATRRTSTVDKLVFDRITGEILGTYIDTPYFSEPVQYPAATSVRTATFIVGSDGSPLWIPATLTPSGHVAPVVPFVTLGSPILQPTQEQPRTGRKASVTLNPLASALCVFKEEGIPTPWLDDYVYGAINTGPGVINGKLSVSPADVSRLLRLSKISVDTASGCLLNHDREPMSERQLQRVVQAARTALRGIALYLERNPEILRTIDVTVDFDQFWPANDAPTHQESSTEPTKRQKALAMRLRGVPIKTTAKELGVSKNTIKRWERESLAA
ncbi:helix-turn-helix domain-containing protein [Pseudomonas sp. JG-B]|uniref:helix-turn-helix domain-containing protein n=1 Tax=Pseudomonas sp. JG-B TaxID=2603214 RepID=UPI00129E710E|nr:helix-turn-helix domain-containing protein [Pseudomonas sp. JG-B]MRK22948.1 helix-turn-helix domain-containing protein [Pseudomonas sp. JG-B]